MWILLAADGRTHFFQFETGFDADNKSSSAVNKKKQISTPKPVHCLVQV